MMTLAFVTAADRGATDALLVRVADTLQARGLRLAGSVQTNVERDCIHHCDMDLRILPDGPVIRINQDLGAGSSGCRLDPGALEQAVAEVEARLTGANLLIVNKFGKREAEGKGLIPVIGDAVDLGIPVLVGVNGLNLAAFLSFAGEDAIALPTDVASVVQWCRQSIVAETV